MAAVVATPDRGDIVTLDFSPTKGHEQSGHRPAIVVTAKAFNRKTNMCWLVPITNTQRGYALEVPIRGSKGQISGVALTQHLRSVDYKARTIKIIDRATASELEEVVSRIRTIIQ